MIDMALLSVLRRWHFSEGMPIREVARRTGLSRNTVRKYLASGDCSGGIAILLTTEHLFSYAKSVDSTSTASNSIKKIKDNWDLYQSIGLLKNWSRFKYRKVGGTN